MRITDFADLIRNLPVDNQAFDIKYDIWKSVDSPLIEHIFKGNKIITISRYDLFQSTENIEEQIIKILMWGFPSKGRGKHIDNFLSSKEFIDFMQELRTVENTNKIGLTEIKRLLRFKGLKLSSLSKILYFRKVKINSIFSLILDQKVINALNSGKFKDNDIEKFKNLKYENALENYINYLEFMQTLANEMKTNPDNVEMFLFEFGLNLK